MSLEFRALEMLQLYSNEMSIYTNSEYDLNLKCCSLLFVVMLTKIICFEIHLLLKFELEVHSFTTVNSSIENYYVFHSQCNDCVMKTYIIQSAFKSFYLIKNAESIVLLLSFLANQK